MPVHHGISGSSSGLSTEDKQRIIISNPVTSIVLPEESNYKIEIEAQIQRASIQKEEYDRKVSRLKEIIATLELEQCALKRAIDILALEYENRNK